MADIDAFTPYADLDEVLVALTVHWRHILAESLAGAYVQGSFALGSGDQHGECDWLVTAHGPLTEPHIAQLCEFHGEIPTREGYWSHGLQVHMHRSPS